MTQRTNLPVEQEYPEINLPKQTSVEYTDQQVLAKLADTKGWKQVRDYGEGRIEFYQKFYPGQDGLDKNSSSEEIALAWKTAVNVISELENFMEQVESAKRVVQAGQQ